MYCSALVASNTPEFIANTVPARPHSAPEITQVMEMMNCVLTPLLRARLRLAEVARIALPKRVYLSNQWMETKTTAQIPKMVSWTPLRIMPRI